MRKKRKTWENGKNNKKKKTLRPEAKWFYGGEEVHLRGEENYVTEDRCSWEVRVRGVLPRYVALGGQREHREDFFFRILLEVAKTPEWLLTRERVIG